MRVSAGSTGLASLTLGKKPAAHNNLASHQAQQDTLHLAEHQGCFLASTANGTHLGKQSSVLLFGCCFYHAETGDCKSWSLTGKLSNKAEEKDFYEHSKVAHLKQAETGLWESKTLGTQTAQGPPSIIQAARGSEPKAFRLGRTNSLNHLRSLTELLEL